MIETAVITAAGYGTRFLPATKNVPKEMLPLIDVPILHEVVKECIDAGMKQIIIVTRHGNDAVEDYFDNNKELEDYLDSRGKLDRYARFNEVFDRADIAYVRQNKQMPYGNASPVLAAKAFIPTGKPFAVLFGDDLVLAKKSGIGQLCDRFIELENAGKDPGGVVQYQEIPREVVSRYGMVKYKNETEQIIETIVEKPSAETTPSLHGSFGRYVVAYDIFNHLAVENIGKDGELWMVDAITSLAQVKNVYAQAVEGKWFTTGDPGNWLRATIAFALARPDLRDEMIEILKESALSLQVE